jgi:hypothetical protein
MVFWIVLTQVLQQLQCCLHHHLRSLSQCTQRHFLQPRSHYIALAHFRHSAALKPAVLQSELSYLRATGLHDKAVEAWQGLSELYHGTQQWSKAVDADQQLVRTWVVDRPGHALWCQDYYAAAQPATMQQACISKSS